MFKKDRIIFVLIGLGIVFVWAYAPEIALATVKRLNTKLAEPNAQIRKDYQVSLAEFGDVYGSINALFAGLAFLGVLVTLYNQQREIENQANSQKTAETAQKKQTDILNKQLKTLSDSFFYQQRRELAKAAPSFVDSLTYNNPIAGLDAKIKILENTILNVEFYSDSVEISPSRFMVLTKDSVFDLRITYKIPMPKVVFTFTIEYTNILGDRVTQLAHWDYLTSKCKIDLEPPQLVV